MGLLDAVSGALTAGTEAAAGAEQGKMQGSQLLRAILMQQLGMQKDRAAIDASAASAAMNRDRGKYYDKMANRPDPSRTVEGSDGTMYSVDGSNRATPIMINAPTVGTPGVAFGAAPSDTGSAPNVLKGPPKPPVPGSPEWERTKIREAQIGAKYGYHPEPLVPVQQPDGSAVYTPRDQAIGKPAKTTTRVENATSVASNARLTAAVSEMNNAHQNMDEYESQLASGRANINGLEQFLAATGSSFTHDDPASRLVQTQALAALNRSNPELARYIRRGLSFAEGESMISNRPSDFRTKMSQFLSTAASGASPEMIHDIQSRRKALLDPLNSAVGKRSAAPAQSGAPAHAPASQAQQLWDAAVAKYGEAKVLQEYGPRPNE